MPRKKSFRKNHKKDQRDAPPRPPTGQGQGQRGGWADIPTENAAYESYYKGTGLVPDEEWETFWETLKRTLPTTFRFTGSKGHALSILRTLRETYIPHLQGIEWENQPVEPPRPLPWFPDNLAWSMTVGKSTIRRCPPFKKFQNFLVAETTVGNISRQEAVSMIPPLLMDVEPHHNVLDMCAAPGSKTAQLIEAIHSGEEAAVEAARTAHPASTTGAGEEVGGRPTGLVIANDADYKRSHMLIHQTKRLNSPNLIVTNHDATMFPSLLTSGPGEPKQYLKFDRILADVPCTGDGTPRKNYSVWRDWTPASALNLHVTQVRILVRGLQMLKVGGKIIYSTCSMNPIENEAVVAAAIDRIGGLEKVSIIDVGDRLPELKRRPGVKGGWKVMDKDGTWFENYDDIFKDDELKEARMSRMTRSMFPTEDGKTDDDPTRIPLERCMRIYPHLQDTGGFFITVLEKKQEIRAVKPEEGHKKKLAAIARAKEADQHRSSTDNDHDTLTETAKPEGDPALNTETVESSITAVRENAAPSTVEPDEDTSPAPRPSSPLKRKLDTGSPAAASAAPTVKKIKQEDDAMSESAMTPDEVATPLATPQPGNIKKKQPGAEEPFKYLAPDHSVIKYISDFYVLSPRFPRSCFMVRNAEGLPSRAIYFTSHYAKKVLEANEGKNVKFVHCGVKAFMRQDVQSTDTCPWRIQNEGLTILSPWIGEERIVHARKRSTVHGLLKELFPKVNGEGIESDVIAEIEPKVRGLSMGCCILKVHKSEGEFGEDMVMPLWKSRHSCNLMLPKEERKALMQRFFDDRSEIVDSTQNNSHLARDKKQREAEASGKTEMEGAQVDVSSMNGLFAVDPEQLAEVEKSANDYEEGINIELMTGQPAGTDETPLQPKRDAEVSAKVPTDEDLEEIIRRQDADKAEAQVKDQVMKDAEL